MLFLRIPITFISKIFTDYCQNNDKITEKSAIFRDYYSNASPESHFFLIETYFWTGCRLDNHAHFIDHFYVQKFFEEGLEDCDCNCFSVINSSKLLIHKPENYV